MEKSGYHTPKKIINKPKNCSLFMPNRSPVKSIERSISSIPYKVIKKFKNNNDLQNESASIKKKRKRFFSVETIPEEQEKKGKNDKNKNNIYEKEFKENINIEENKNDYFVNFAKNVYINESHLSKNNIIKSPRKKDINNSKSNYISTKTILNNTSQRKMSAMNSDLFSINFNKRKNTENQNMIKDGLTVNTNYKTNVKNKKLCQKLDNILHKKKLSENEKEFIINYLEKKKDLLNSPKHKIKNNEVRVSRKKQIKEKIETVKTQNENNNNNILLISDKVNTEKTKFKWFNIVLCCFKAN